MKFEFGDLYRFIVSLGVIFIASAFVIPWLFLKESFDVLKSQQGISHLSDTASNIISKREGLILFAYNHLSTYFFISLFIGLSLVCYGLKKWRSNQLVLDEQTKLELELKKRANEEKEGLKNSGDEYLTLEKCDDKIELKNNNNKLSSCKGSSAKSFTCESGGRTSKESFTIQSQISQILYKNYTNDYQIALEKLVANVRIDIVLKGRGLLSKDWLIEIKVIHKGFGLSWLRDNFIKINYARTVYTQFENRTPNTLLLIVIDDDSYDKEKYTKMVNYIQSEGHGRSEKDRIVILKQSEILNSNKQEFSKLTGI